MKHYNDTTGNRTRDLPACSALPQPTAPPRAPQLPKRSFKSCCCKGQLIAHYQNHKVQYRQHKSPLFTFTVKQFHPQHYRLCLNDTIEYYPPIFVLVSEVKHERHRNVSQNVLQEHLSPQQFKFPISHHIYIHNFYICIAFCVTDVTLRCKRFRAPSRYATQLTIQ